jgi:hypothetical protein
MHRSTIGAPWYIWLILGIPSFLAFLFGALSAGTASDFLVAALSYPRCTGYLDANCSFVSGQGLPRLYKYGGRVKYEEFCCDVDVSVSPLKTETPSFVGFLKRRNCLAADGLLEWNNKNKPLTCPGYYAQMEVQHPFTTSLKLNGTKKEVTFACKYNPEKRSSPFEVCIPDSFSCDTVSLNEHKELQNYDQRQKQFIPLYVLFILIGFALILLGGMWLRKLSSGVASLSPSQRAFSKFDDDRNEKSGAALA